MFIQYKDSETETERSKVYERSMVTANVLHEVSTLGCWRYCGRVILFQVQMTFLLQMGANTAVAQEWWQSTSVYQIYPRSFNDTDGDGIGDLRGIINKLDHVDSLGTETIWISPFFESPQQDFGYDISDYYSIAPEYGDTQTCQRLIQEIHARGMKVVFDLVMNHTSDQHQWFKESASGKNNPKADWYVWRDGTGKDGRKPPNNWKAMIGGNGWHWHEGRQQFYWSSFLPFQPDLNYHNPEVKKAMLDVARFWLSKGVDGFRLDIFNSIYEDSLFRKNPGSLSIVPSEENPDGFFQKMKYNVNQEASFEFATELRAVVDSFQDPPRFMIGEVFGDLETIRKFCHYQGRDGLHTVFLFQTLSTPFKARKWRKTIAHFEEHFPPPFVPTYVFSNHDRRRSITPLGNDVHKAKLMAVLQYTVRGIPFTYYGEELGMEKPRLPMKEGKDPLAQRFSGIPQFLVDWSGQSLNRDECRTPMLWDSTKNAGFSNGEPWLPVSEKFREKNADAAWADSNSLLRHYQRIIALRNREPTLQNGELIIDEERCNGRILAYWRITDSDRLLVLLNFSARSARTDIPQGKTLLSTHSDADTEHMLPFEGRVIRPD